MSSHRLSMVGSAAAVCAAAAALGGAAVAQPSPAPPAAPAEAPPRPPPAPPSARPPASDDTPSEDAEMDPFDKIRELEARLDQQQAVILARQPRVQVGGYIDFGFFATTGNGSGIVRDEGHTAFPQYSNYGWLFYGDILSTAVNSRGEVADLGDAAGVERFDSIHSGGAPGFIVNEINLKLS